MEGRIWALHVDTYDVEHPEFPVCRHTFYGLNQEQCKTFYGAHLRGDKSLQGAARGEYLGQPAIIKTKFVMVQAHRLHAGLGEAEISEEEL